VFKKRLARKLTEQYVGLHIIERVIRYRKLVKKQKVKKPKPIEIDEKKEQEVERIINKRIV